MSCASICMDVSIYSLTCHECLHHRMASMYCCMRCDFSCDKHGSFERNMETKRWFCSFFAIVLQPFYRFDLEELAEWDAKPSMWRIPLQILSNENTRLVSRVRL